MSDFGFVGAAYQAPSIYQDAQECINWYPEVDNTKPDGSRGVVALYPTPGLLEKLQLPIQAELRALYPLTGGGTMLAVCGANVYLVSAAFAATKIGALSTSGGIVSISDNGIEAMLADGQNRYSYTIGTQSISIIGDDDGGFRGAGKVDIVDDFLVYNHPDSNQWGCTSPLSTASPALSFSSKDGSSDNLVTLIVDHREVFLIGAKTTEVWVNVGSFPFPFQRIPGTSMQHGCAAKNSVSRLGESTAWLSQDTRGQAIVIQMVSYQPKRISTHAVESDISGGVIDDATAYTYQQGGHEFYMLNFPTQDKTWVYDLATNMWHKRASRDSNNVLHRHRGNCYATFQGLNLVGDFENGKIYSLSQSTYTDNGATILRMRRCPHLTENLKRVCYDELQIQFQPGVGLSTGQGSDPQMMLRWSNDGGSTWSNYYPIPIGKQGRYKNRARRTRMGQARDRIYEVTITDPINAVIVSANLVAEVEDA